MTSIEVEEIHENVRKLSEVGMKNYQQREDFFNKRKYSEEIKDSYGIEADQKVMAEKPQEEPFSAKMKENFFEEAIFSEAFSNDELNRSAMKSCVST